MCVKCVLIGLNVVVWATADSNTTRDLGPIMSKGENEKLLTLQEEKPDAGFFIYTRSNPEDGQRITYRRPESISNSNYNPRVPTKVIIHGFTGSIFETGPTQNRRAFLKLGDYNVLMVDWSREASGTYYRAVQATEYFGRQIARIVELMIQLGASGKDFHMVGLSLGAHMAGFAGKALGNVDIKIGRITGLDPAGFMFQRLPDLVPFAGLAKTDAEYVEVIHTSAGSILYGRVGIAYPIGHVDYYVNGGDQQPGCFDGADLLLLVFNIMRNSSKRLCSHRRSWDLYIETLTTNCDFVGFPCPDVSNFERDFVHGDCFSCKHDSCGYMGHTPEFSPGRGSMYFVTRPRRPYCGDQFQAVVLISRKTKRTRGNVTLEITVNDRSISFSMNSRSNDTIEGDQMLSRVVSAEHGILHKHVDPKEIIAILTFRPRLTMQLLGRNHIYFKTAIITDQTGYSWHYCGNDVSEDREKPFDRHLGFQVYLRPC